MESRARRFRPASTPVSAITSRTTSKIRCGRSEAASRRRQYVNVDGWNPGASIASPHAAFHLGTETSEQQAVQEAEAPSAPDPVAEDPEDRPEAADVQDGEDYE